MTESNINQYLISGKHSDGSWISPSNWTGPCPVLYQSFDSSDGFVLMEGTQATLDNVPLVSGKVRHVRLFQKNNQYEIKQCSKNSIKLLINYTEILKPVKMFSFLYPCGSVRSKFSLKLDAGSFRISLCCIRNLSYTYWSHYFIHVNFVKIIYFKVIINLY